MNNRVSLGKIINIRGLNGEVKIESTTSFARERYKDGNKFYLHNYDTSDEIVVHSVSCSIVGKFNFVKFSEITTPEQANAYRNYFVEIDQDSLPKLQDSYYYHQLIGLDVFDENNKFIGKVLKVEEYPKNAILRIKTDKEILIPFIKQFVLDVDINNNKITVLMMEGL